MFVFAYDLDDNFQNFGTNVSTVLLGDLMFMLVMS